MIISKSMAKCQIVFSRYSIFKFLDVRRKSELVSKRLHSKKVAETTIIFEEFALTYSSVHLVTQITHSMSNLVQKGSKLFLLIFSCWLWNYLEFCSVLQ